MDGGTVLVRGHLADIVQLVLEAPVLPPLGAQLRLIVLHDQELIPRHYREWSARGSAGSGEYRPSPPACQDARAQEGVGGPDRIRLAGYSRLPQHQSEAVAKGAQHMGIWRSLALAARNIFPSTARPSRSRSGWGHRRSACSAHCFHGRVGNLGEDTTEGRLARPLPTGEAKVQQPGLPVVGRPLRNRRLRPRATEHRHTDQHQHRQ